MLYLDNWHFLYIDIIIINGAVIIFCFIAKYRYGTANEGENRIILFRKIISTKRVE